MPSLENALPDLATCMPPDATRYALVPKTLLLVEDSRYAAEAVRFVCRRAGIRLRRAETLASAHLHLSVYRPDVALIDIGLPDGSGLDLIHAISSRIPRPGRIIAVSGDDAFETPAFDAGADGFLLKPVTIAQHLEFLTAPVGQANCYTPSSNPESSSPGTRNAGGDPLALRDDLRMICDLLNGPDDPERTRYAGQFLSSIGRSMGDAHLARHALRAARDADRNTLTTLAQAQLHEADLSSAAMCPMR